MAWLFFFIGFGSGVFWVWSSFEFVGAAIICGLSFVAAAVYEVAAVLRQLTEVLGAADREMLLPKKVRQPPADDDLHPML